MPLALRELNLGKVDGKHEYLTPISARDRTFHDAFLVPETIDISKISNGGVCFVEGFRGTGKTSLLRWYAEDRRKAGSYTDFILFKSDLTEQQRLHISNEIGISWTDADSGRMEVSQDFKTAWGWFIHHKIGEAILIDDSLSEGESADVYMHLLGIRNSAIFTKSLGFLPRLEGAHVRVKADIPFFEVELGGDFESNKSYGRTTLDALVRRLNKIITGMNFAKPMYIFFDELEVFFSSEEQLRRDQRMVRDLLFAIDSLNTLFRQSNIPIHVVGAVRSEVINSFGAIGQEVDRVIHDRGFKIAWYYAKRSKNHPLLEIVRRKIWASEEIVKSERSIDPIESYFLNQIDDLFIDAFLLDKSFYKPRDIIWRLTIAQKQFPSARSFNKQVLIETETEYSARLWDEIAYELGASYSSDEIAVIEGLLAGFSIYFDMVDIEGRLKKRAKYSMHASSLEQRKSVQDVLEDLYRLGAIGNAFRTGASGNAIRNRWAFRGDPSLLADKRMTLHPALAKRLSAVVPRRRGAPGRRAERR